MNEDIEKNEEIIRKDLGFIERIDQEDIYKRNILWILKNSERLFDVKGIIRFPLDRIMERFGSEEKEFPSFLRRQNVKVDLINRLKEYKGYHVTCGIHEKKGKFKFFYYQRFPIEDGEEDNGKIGGEEKELTYFGNDGTELKIGSTIIDSKSLKGAVVEEEKVE